jgi:glycosyltransferase involved in cell wall biosynthesis
MKICHITFAYYPQYAAIYEYCTNLAKQGHHVEVIALGKENDQPYETIKGVQVNRLLSSANITQSRFQTQYSFIFNLKRFLSQHAPFDVIHAHAFRGVGLLPILYKHASHKWIIDVRTVSLALGFRGKTSHIITRLESKCFQERIAIAEKVGETIFGPSLKWQTIPLGVNVNTFHPTDSKDTRAQLGYKDHEYLFVYCGTLRPVRRLENIISSFHFAASANEGIKLLILGDGPSLPILKKQVKTLGIENCVKFLGHVPYEDVPKFLQIADAALSYIPITPYFDFQPPTKTLEYMACGLPTIATATYANQQLISHGKNGLLVADNSIAFANAICQLLENKKHALKMGNLAREDAHQYSWDRIVKIKLIPLYER